MKGNVLLAILILLLSPVAFGGASNFGPDDTVGVSVTEGDGSPTGGAVGNVLVQGTLSYVRFTKDNVQQLGCQIFASAGFTSATCTGVDITGSNYTCFSSDPAIIDAIQSISPYSYIRYEMAGGIAQPGMAAPVAQCENLLVATRSVHIPDSKSKNRRSK